MFSILWLLICNRFMECCNEVNGIIRFGERNTLIMVLKGVYDPNFIYSFDFTSCLFLFRVYSYDHS